LLDVCWKFAGHLLDSVNTLLVVIRMRLEFGVSDDGNFVNSLIFFAMLSIAVSEAKKGRSWQAR